MPMCDIRRLSCSIHGLFAARFTGCLYVGISSQLTSAGKRQYGWEVYRECQR